jgi:uncharacterized protein
VLSSEDHRQALAIARRAIDRAVGPSPPADPAAAFRTAALPPVFDERRGVFVTLKRFPDDALRGCIGFPLPQLALRAGLPRSAVAAAVEDPRFAPVRSTELSRLRVEISVLTVPIAIDVPQPEARVEEVEVGRDGLIVEGFGRSGLLLPQVAPEQGWSPEELLEGTCEKAGLRPDAWRNPAVTVHRFGAEVFRERVPGGEPELVAPQPRASAGPAGPRS